MKKLMIVLLLPLFAGAQVKNVVSSERIFPKIEKLAEFEKALANHAQKFHTGKWKWRVFFIESGPDYGGYHIVEGPNTWDDFDARGNLGEEHMNDWNKNVAPLLINKVSASYSVFKEELSSVRIDDYANWINITHVFPKVGYNNEVENMIKKAKKAWEEGKQSVAVYESSSSGPSQFAVVTRYKEGLKEKNANFRSPFKDRYNKVNGEDSYNSYLEGIRKYIERSWSELLSFQPQLSSK